MGRKKGPSIRTLRRRLKAEYDAAALARLDHEAATGKLKMELASLPICRNPDGTLALKSPAQWAPGDLAFISGLGKTPAQPTLQLLEWVEKRVGLYMPDRTRTTAHI